MGERSCTISIRSRFTKSPSGGLESSRSAGSTHWPNSRRNSKERPMADSRFVYVTYIRTTPEKLWQALTDPAFIRQYWCRIQAESDWTPGSSWQLIIPDGRVADSGEILEAEPGKRLV